VLNENSKESIALCGDAHSVKFADGGATSITATSTATVTATEKGPAC